MAKDGLSVYVNDANPLTELTMEQLKGIFTGKVTNWKELGGPDAKIIPYSRENSSGTYVFFKEHVLANADYTPRAQAMPGTAAVVNAVSKEKFGDRLRRRCLRQGDQGPQDQEGRGVAGDRPDGRDHQGRHVPAVAPAVLLPARQPIGRDQGLQRLGAVARRAGGRHQGGIFPHQIA